MSGSELLDWPIEVLVWLADMIRAQFHGSAYRRILRLHNHDSPLIRASAGFLR